MTGSVHWCCRLQETFSDDLREAGRIPRTVDCELTRDLGTAAAVFVIISSFSIHLTAVTFITFNHFGKFKV